MPRYKTCGGGVNVRAANHIPFSIQPVVERVISRYRFTYQGQKPFEKSCNQPLTFMTQRLRLDKFLLDQAEAAGAHIMQGVTVRKVEALDHATSVVTDSGERIGAEVVVGADGANSVVARDLVLMKDVRRELALESEIELSPDAMTPWHDTIEIDLFSVSCGYGWVFPKEHHISIGVGGLKADVKGIQTYNEAYLRRHDTQEGRLLRFSGHALPVRRGTSAVVRGNGLLVGDAAGLLEPFSGEGIGYAIRSGQIASESIVEFLSGSIPSLDAYAQRLDEEITPELILAEKFMLAFNRFPQIFYRLLRDNDRAWRAVCRVLRGELRMVDVAQRLGGFRSLLNMV
jgi:geranylgeranyl reductase family protein